MDVPIRYGWLDREGAHIVVRVRERWGVTEYHGIVPRATWQTLTTDLARRAELRAAVKAVRDARVAPPIVDETTMLSLGASLTI